MSTPGAGTGPSQLPLEGQFAFGAPVEDGIAEDRGQALFLPKDDTVASAPSESDRNGTTAFEFFGTGTKPDTGDPTNPVVAHVLRQAGLQRDGTTEDHFQGSGVQPKTGDGPAPVQILVARLSEVLEQTEGTVLQETAGRITVTRDGESALISLTDDQNFGMFAIGSAEPRPELVKLLERIGKVVAETPGRIVIKGHTDARPFKSETYDNWRLSSARAHMALYMLSRGGVDKARFDRVESYADRQLKVPAEPFAAPNRRIEIYLLEGSE